MLLPELAGRMEIAIWKVGNMIKYGCVSKDEIRIEFRIVSVKMVCPFHFQLVVTPIHFEY